MTLTAPGCPVAGEMPIWVENAVAAVPGVAGVKVAMVLDPAVGSEPHVGRGAGGVTATLSPSLLLEASMNYDGNIINITNSANTLQPAGWVNNVFFANSGSNEQSGVNWGGNGIGGSVATGYGPWHNAAEDYEPR